jgi:hypothetical protein
MLGMMLFSASRFLFTIGKETREGFIFPARIRVMNIIWILGYSLSALCFVQFQQYGEQIMNFGNALLAYIENSRSEDMSL